MENKIKKILKELSKIDPKLKNREKELEEVIQKMIELKPNIKIDNEFKENLRKRIYSEIEIKKFKSTKVKNKIDFLNIFSYISGLSGLIVIGIFVYMINSGDLIFKNNKDDSLVSPDSIEQIKGGFGDGGEEMMISKTFSTQKDEAVLLGDLGNSLEKTKNMMMVSGNNLDIKQEIYRYNFSGNLDFLGLKGKMPVYKKEKTKINDFNNILKEISFDGLKLDNFKNLEIPHISLKESRDYGYVININFSDNTLDINQNHEKWPMVNYDRNSKNKFLSEEKLFLIVSNFVEKYNINLSNYGKPVIDKFYIEAKNSSEKHNFYSVNITYPLIIDGNEVYNQNGEKYGVSFEIDLKEEKVLSVSGLELINFLKSDYEIETNKENIIKIVNSRENNFGDNNENAQYTDVNLRNPKFVYMFYVERKNGKTEKYLVPSIIFETNKTRKIIISLVKEKLKK